MEDCKQKVLRRKILFVRSMPSYLNPKAYNVQPIGMGKAFCRLGYDFDYIAPMDKEPKKYVFYMYDGCRALCREVKWKRFMRWGIINEVCNDKFLSQYDIIISQEYYQLMTYKLSKISNRVVMWAGPYWNMFMFKPFSLIYDSLFAKKINRRTLSKLTKSTLATHFLEEKGFTNVHEVGVGIDFERFDSKEPITKATKELCAFMNKNPCLLYVGNLCENKNFSFMLRVFIRLLKDYPSLHFVMIGRGNISAFAKIRGKKATDYVESEFCKIPLDVRNHILHIECIDNSQLAYVYPLAKAFLLPSKLEVFGMVLLEAMYLGAPVVTSRNGGATMLIEGKESGQIVEKFDVEEYANAIMAYLDDPVYTNRIKANAKAVIEKEYKWDAVCKRILSFCDTSNP